MQVHYWGVRGSISAPGALTCRYGGNTPCIEVTDREGFSVILDAGYGIVGVGEGLMAASQGRPVTAHLLLSHLHWDHIQGLPFFAPLYCRKSEVVIYCGSAELAHRALERLFTSVYSPIKGVENLGATLRFETLRPGLTLGKLEIDAFTLHHSVPTLGFRIAEEGRVLVHATDHEAGSARHDDALIEASRKVHLLIHDAHHTYDEYPQYVGWGHSSTQSAVDNALRAEVETLALFHYAPQHTDVMVDEQLAIARELAKESNVSVMAAAEGVSLKV